MRGYNSSGFFTKIIEYISSLIIAVSVTLNKFFHFFFGINFSEFCVMLINWFKRTKPYTFFEAEFKYTLRFVYTFIVQSSILRDLNLFTKLLVFFAPWYVNIYVQCITSVHLLFDAESQKNADTTNATPITESVLVLFVHFFFLNQKHLLNDFFLINYPYNFNEKIYFSEEGDTDSSTMDTLETRYDAIFNENANIFSSLYIILKFFIIDKFHYYKNIVIILDLQNVIDSFKTVIFSLPNFFATLLNGYWWLFKHIYPTKWILGSNIIDILFSGFSITGHVFIFYKHKGSYFTISSYYYNIFNGYYTDDFKKYTSKKYSYLDDHKVLPVIPDRPIYFSYTFDSISNIFVVKKLTFKDLTRSGDSVLPKLLKSVYTFSKKAIIGLIVSILFITFSFFTFQLSFLKVVANWVFILLFAYWLFSGFNFFLKRYKYGKFTSAIQRFWKRAFMCFWMIEGFLFLLFFYYLLNSSSEPVFMYDQISLYTEQLLSWKVFLFNSMLTVVIINLVQVFLINLKNKTSRFSYILIFLITVFLLVILLTEGYQFYYIVNFYDEAIWVFSEEDNLWELEHDTPRTRTKNHYLTLCILAKFWHYIFIFLVWVFCLMKFFETGRVSYTLISVNYQNLIIFYLMSWIFMFSWLKWFSRRFLDTQYFWFFSSYRDWHFKLLVNDLILYFMKITSSVLNMFLYIKASYTQIFFYVKALSYHNYNKDSILRNYFVQNSITI